MSSICERIQNLLSMANEDEARAELTASDQMQSHISECDECFALFEAMTELEENLALQEEFDAPDELVARVIESVEQFAREEESVEERDPWKGVRAVFSVLANLQSIIFPRNGFLYRMTGSIATASLCLFLYISWFGNPVMNTFYAGEGRDSSLLVTQRAPRLEKEARDESELALNAEIEKRVPLKRGSGLSITYNDERIRDSGSSWGFFGGAKPDETRLSAGGKPSTVPVPRRQRGDRLNYKPNRESSEPASDRPAVESAAGAAPNYREADVQDYKVGNERIKQKKKLSGGDKEAIAERADIHPETERVFRKIIEAYEREGGRAREEKREAGKKRYLKVTEDRWAVSDAFEMEGELNGIPKDTARSGEDAPMEANIPVPEVRLMETYRDNDEAQPDTSAEQLPTPVKIPISKLTPGQSGLIGAAQGSIADPEKHALLDGKINGIYLENYQDCISANMNPSGEGLNWVDANKKCQVTTDYEQLNQGTANVGNASTPTEEALTVAQGYLSLRRSIEGLRFKEAKGYWSNTYVPGDRTLRSLYNKLLSQDKQKLALGGSSVLNLDDLARQTSQPFDAPSDAAIAAYLHADRIATEGPSRMLVQVGLKGTERRSGSRPAMNLGLVLDLNAELDSQTEREIRSLITAFSRAKDIGDNFSLMVTGRSGAVVIKPKDFRHGPLSLALDSLFSENHAGVLDLTLSEAVEQSIDLVQGKDDPKAPLGSSAVIVIATGALGDATKTLSEMAHTSAVAGVPVSAIGVGNKVNLRQLDKIVLAGQGSRRVLKSAADAVGLVDRELSSVSRVVARALRLRIRLKPGVKLVNILGSRRFDEIQAERVREAEKSIDQRMAKNLGIVADRGEDEEGIQIVIPAFYAGDAHAILLDVVAPGPGPIADLTVRYKDLVHLKNNVARANLTLKQGSEKLGPLELNVIKNLLAYDLSKALRDAGTSLKLGGTRRAITLTEHYLTLLKQLQQHFPALKSDPDLNNDMQMLSEYLGVLRSGRTLTPDQLSHLSNSLHFASRLKLLPRPEQVEVN